MKVATNNQFEGIDMSENNFLPPRRIFLILAASIFAIEFVIMVIFLVAPMLPPILETIVDATSLTLLSAPIIYRFAIRPLYEQINRNHQMSQQYEERNKALERSMEEQTTELKKRSEELGEQAKELEKAYFQLQKRAAQFEALAQVTQDIASIHDLQELLPRVATVISERFGFYHVGIFLLDEMGEYAMLSAANSEGGRRMLERSHHLRVGEQGIVGNVTATGVPRIAMDVGKDAVFFNNPDLPNTHSEMALPLQNENSITGALDVQSTEAAAFTEEDIQMLGLLARQVSLAIENARLFEATRRALAELEAIGRQFTREAWKRLPAEQSLIGFRYNITGASPLNDPVKLTEVARSSGKDGPEDASQVIVPIKLRGETIGTLVVQSQSANTLNQDQRDLIEAVAERVALSAENARLFEETTRRGERERLVSDITGKIRSVNDPQTMIQTAMEELRKVLGASRVEVIPQAVKVPSNHQEYEEL